MTLPGCRWSGISLKNERNTVVSTNAAQTVSAIRPSSIPNQRMATDSDQIRFVTYFFTRLPWIISDLQLSAPFRVLFKGRLPSRFLCSTWEPVSSSRPALLPGRRAQLPSRLAVGERRQRCPLSPGHALTVASTASGYGRLGRFRALLRESGPRD